MMLVVGLYHPKTAAACGMLWVVGRFIYGYGYALGNPNYRTPGGILSHLGDLPLMAILLKIAFNVAKSQF